MRNLGGVTPTLGLNLPTCYWRAQGRLHFIYVAGHTRSHRACSSRPYAQTERRRGMLMTHTRRRITSRQQPPCKRSLATVGSPRTNPSVPTGSLQGRRFLSLVEGEPRPRGAQGHTAGKQQSWRSPLGHPVPDLVPTTAALHCLPATDPQGQLSTPAPEGEALYEDVACDSYLVRPLWGAPWDFYPSPCPRHSHAWSSDGGR